MNQWLNFLVKQHGDRLMVHDILRPIAERVREMENKEEIEYGIRAQRLHAVSDTNVLYNIIGGIGKLQILTTKSLMNLMLLRVDM